MKRIGIFFLSSFLCISSALAVLARRKTYLAFPAGLYATSYVNQGREKYAKKEKQKAIINKVVNSAMHFLRGQKFVNQRRFN